jgi:hypothetical protein
MTTPNSQLPTPKAQRPRPTGRREKAVWGTCVRLAAVAGLAALSASCGTQVTQGTTSSYLIMTSLQGEPGGSGSFGPTLQSDVVSDTGTKVSDLGQAAFQLALKDPGGTASPNTPTQNNFITVTGYHVQYIRSDGRNTQGVDVPYAFDGALTATVSGNTTVTFTLVRLQAKLEAPLAALATNNIPFTAVAQVTFYGHDQTGRDASVTGSIEITFANFAG